ncbi:energy-coupling factor transporter transmembrane component T family protein [Liberiplasma polymorphum]|jgi:energy-coupling factor transport system permease protein|uniref:energy-coupling factor transporter transmembrane component T family protein n=1 Tax=Liberiplasma polymorphum TaxID=3374570 RepID=UPI00377332EC
MKNIVIGRFIPGNSFLYKMDPRTKIIALIILMVAAFMIGTFTQMFIGMMIILFILIIGRISVKRVYLGLRPLMFLLFFTFSFQIFFNTQGEIVFDYALNYSILNFLLVGAIIFIWIVTKKYIKLKLIYFLFTVFISFYVLINLELGDVYRVGQFTVYEQGLETAFFIMMRLIIIVTLSTILTLTTKPTDLNLGLEAVLKPLKYVRVNTEEMAMIIALSLRYIPTLLDEANKIMLAQASRGVDFTEGKLKDKVMQIISLLIPMFIISFKRSDELADAMEARSFVPGKMRTRLHLLTWTAIDTFTIIFSIAMLTLTIVLRVVY